jgi:ABC-2 type transport system ATP-binding protein
VVEGTPEELKRELRGDAVSVELADGRGSDAADLVRALAGVSETVLDGKLLRARVENGARAVPAIMSALDGAGIPAASVTVARPSLDDVYLHYTGRDFAEEDRA